MKKFLLLGLFFVCGVSFGQDKYLNKNGTISDQFKRDYLVAFFNENNKEGTRFDIDNKYFVVITNYNCGDNKYAPEEMQKRALHYSFQQLLSQISILKLWGYKSFSDINFEGIIFKTNTMCMYSTRRYNFKFTLNELESFPDYMDFDELFDYVVVKNKNKNIIYAKNSSE